VGDYAEDKLAGPARKERKADRAAMKIPQPRGSWDTDLVTVAKGLLGRPWHGIGAADWKLGQRAVRGMLEREKWLEKAIGLCDRFAIEYKDADAAFPGFPPGAWAAELVKGAEGFRAELDQLRIARRRLEAHLARRPDTFRFFAKSAFTRDERGYTTLYKQALAAPPCIPWIASESGPGRPDERHNQKMRRVIIGETGARDELEAIAGVGKYEPEAVDERWLERFAEGAKPKRGRADAGVGALEDTGNGEVAGIFAAVPDQYEDENGKVPPPQRLGEWQPSQDGRAAYRGEVRDRTPKHWRSRRPLNDADPVPRGRLATWPVMHRESRVAKDYRAPFDDLDWEYPRNGCGWYHEATLGDLERARANDRRWWSSASLDEQVRALEEYLLRPEPVERMP
jgi:hypothetical protein